MICSEKELREAFNHFDDDNNDAIDREEFAKVMQAFGAGMSEQELDIGFQEIDSDSSGSIEFDEFWNWMCDMQG